MVRADGPPTTEAYRRPLTARVLPHPLTHPREGPPSSRHIGSPATAGAPGVLFTSRVLFGASNARCRPAHGQHGCPDTASHPRSGRQARRTSRCSKAQSARSDRSSPVARGASAGRHRLLGLRLSWIGHSLIGVWWGPGHQAGLSHRAVSFGFTFLGGAGSRLRSTAREERQSAGIEPHTSGQKRSGLALYRGATTGSARPNRAATRRILPVCFGTSVRRRTLAKAIGGTPECYSIPRLGEGSSQRNLMRTRTFRPCADCSKSSGARGRFALYKLIDDPPEGWSITAA